LSASIDVTDQKTQPALSQIGREEKAAAADKVSPIVRHRASMARLKVMGFAALNQSYGLRHRRVRHHRRRRNHRTVAADTISRGCLIAPFVGWVERSETHHFAVIAATRRWVSLRSTHPTGFISPTGNYLPVDKEPPLKPIRKARAATNKIRGVS
jgi:hypothetical protein